MAFKKVAGKSEIKPGEGKQVDVGEKVLAIFNIDGEFYCIDGKCKHRGGPLAEGFVSGKIVSCPWHGAEFDVTTGEVKGPPAKENVACYKVKVEGDDILVEI